MAFVSLYSISDYLVGESFLLMRPKTTPKGIIIALHGHGASSLQFIPYVDSQISGPGYHVWKLVEAGYLVCAIDAGGPLTWGNASSVAAVSSAITWLNTKGYDVSKVGIMGWSMGTAVGLNWIKRNPTKVFSALLWAVMPNLDWARNNSSAWATEQDAAYGNNYALNSPGYKIADEPASFRNICPIKIYHGDADATIPILQAQEFVADVNDPLVSLTTVAGKDHSTVFGGVTAQSVIQFFKQNWFV
jgi:pimeloyl-ACP methyl ester carboxylesterase